MTQNGQVVRDYVTNASTGAFVRCLDFFYDQNGRPFAMRSYYDSTLTGYDTFHYVLNAQGDVVQLNYQGRQDKVYAQYTYDAWGNVLAQSGSPADVNPLRYRGYYCDTETGFYYLRSRYYDPTVKRFLNADSYGSTGQGLLGFNMFAYCMNSPVNNADSSGHLQERSMVVCDGGSSPKVPVGGGGKRNDSKPTYITDQNDPIVASCDFGLSSVGHSGCGPISVYNALIMLGDYASMEEILDFYDNEWYWGHLLFGYCGSLPIAACSFFEQRGYRVEVTSTAKTDPDYIDAMASCADANILWYLFKTDWGILGDGFGGHFVAFERTGERGQLGFIGYNTNTYTSTFRRPSKYLLEGSRFTGVVISIFKEG